MKKLEEYNKIRNSKHSKDSFSYDNSTSPSASKRKSLKRRPSLMRSNSVKLRDDNNSSRRQMFARAATNFMKVAMLDLTLNKTKSQSHVEYDELDVKQHSQLKLAHIEAMAKHQRIIANRTKNSSSLIAFAKYLFKLLQAEPRGLNSNKMTRKPDVTLLQKIDPEVLEMITKAEQ
eukprot:gene36591-45129_t